MRSAKLPEPSSDAAVICEDDTKLRCAGDKHARWTGAGGRERRAGER